MSQFVIFEDQENLHEKHAATMADAKRDRQKLAPLSNKLINNENAFENQVRTRFVCRFIVFVVIPFIRLSNRSESR